MRVKRILLVGILILLLTVSLYELTYGFEIFGVRNTRVGYNVFVAAGETIEGGLFTCGPNVEIAGDIRGGIKACGANLVIPGTVQGDLNFCGPNVVLSGTYHNKVKGRAANLTLSGTFEDTVEVRAAKLTLAPTAIVKGDLLFSAPALERQEGARIMGKVIQQERKGALEWRQKWGEKGKKALWSLGIIFWVISIPAIIIVGLLVNYLFPKQTDVIVSTISESPWKSLGVGFIFLVVVPVAIIISLITLVGIPAGIIAGLLYVILIYISRIYVGVWTGRKFLGYFKKSLTTAFFWPLVVGNVIIALLILIPFIGWLFRLFVLFIGLGALYLVGWRSFTRARAETRPIT